MPPTLPEFAPDDPAVQLLVTWYRQMEAQLVDTMIEGTLEAWEEDVARDRLRQIRAQLQRLEGQAAAQDQETLAREYRRGLVYADEALREIEGLPLDRIDDIPYTLPTRALEQLAKDAAGQRSAFLNDILRRTDDYLRRLASGEIAEGLGLGKSSYAVGKAIREGLIEGVRSGAVQEELARQVMTSSGVVYTDGSVHSLHAYGQMSARTGMANALRAGQVDRFQQAGVHVVRIPNNGTLCFRCFPFEGRCFALDVVGERMGYPPIRIWRANGEHPNCRHLAYSPVYRPNPERDIPPDDWDLSADHADLYRRFRDEHPELYQASRHGFASRGELEQWKRANPDIPEDQLRGPRWRYHGIETRRQAAIEEMLEEPGLSYSEAMERQTRDFMATPAYGKQREKTGDLSPAAQRKAAEGR
jgi:hypothetical protein